jgi:alpha-L-fucosidase
MRVNGESIYGTNAGPFKKLEWGRCTRKDIEGGKTRLYLHLFEWPADHRLVIPGISNEPAGAAFLGNENRRSCGAVRYEDAIVIELPARSPDRAVAVVALDVIGDPVVFDPPGIQVATDVFVDELAVTFDTSRPGFTVRYTTDGTTPTARSVVGTSPAHLRSTATVTARLFRGESPVSGVSRATFEKVVPAPGVRVEAPTSGLRYAYYEGEWDLLPDFDIMVPVKRGVTPTFDLLSRGRDERFGFVFSGYVHVPTDGVYTFATRSDDGSRLHIDGHLVADNDGAHVMQERSGRVALAAGFHPIRVAFFERTGDDGLIVTYEGSGIASQPIPATALWHAGGDQD